LSRGGESNYSRNSSAPASPGIEPPNLARLLEERQRVYHRRRPVWLISVFQEPVATILPAAPLILLPATRPAITKKFNYGFSSVTALISSPEKYRAIPRLFPVAKRAPKLNGGVFQHLAAVARRWLIHQP